MRDCAVKRRVTSQLTNRWNQGGMGALAGEVPPVPGHPAPKVIVDVTRVGDSCGYGVPLMAFEGTRDHHALATAKRLRTGGEDGYRAHRAQSNLVSLDGLPAVDGTA